MTESVNKKKIAGKRLLIPGQRLLRSVIASMLCLLIYVLRGRSGMPFYSIIAALQCIQPYSANMMKVGKNRITGTLVGAFWGAILLFSELYLMGGGYEETYLHYFLLCIGVGVVIYSTVLLKITEASYFSCVVFLSICLNHIGDVNPYMFVLNRTMDTVIGVGVAILVNSVHMPRKRDLETLYVSGVDHVLFREDRNLSTYTKINLNRLIADGARFTVSTKQTPATVRELLQGVNLKLPIIAMDGAVLYDMKNMKYLRAEKMDDQLAEKITAFLHEKKTPFYVNTIEDHLLVISFRRDTEEESQTAVEAMRRLYEKKRTSPHRNYVRTTEDVCQNVVYFMVIDRKENVRRLFIDMMKQPWAIGCRAAFDTFECMDGEEIMRIYAAGATRKNMLEELRKITGAERVVTFGCEKDECDVLIPDAGGGNIVRELKKRFEPVSIERWKNMLRL